MALGIVFGVGLLLLSVVKDDPWNDHVYANAPPIAAGVASPHRAGRQKMVCSSCHEIIDPQMSGRARIIPPIAPDAVSPHRDGREKQLCSHCHKIISRQQAVQSITVAQVIPQLPANDPARMDPEWHERFITARFQGKIIRVVEKTVQSGRENINILVDNGVTRPAWYNLAPDRFLQEVQCGVRAGLFVKGTAYKEMAAGGNRMLYIKTISVNGQFCDIRDGHMIGRWEPGASRGHHGDEE